MLCRVALQPRDGLIDMPVHVDGNYEQDWADLRIVDLSVGHAKTRDLLPLTSFSNLSDATFDCGQPSMTTLGLVPSVPPLFKLATICERMS